VLVVPYHVIRGDDIFWPSPATADERAVREHLAVLPDDALAMSDDPGVIWRAGRVTPPDLVDTSSLRMEAGDITEDVVVEVAATPEVCAVAIWSPTRWGSYRDLPDRLTAEGYELALDLERGRRLYVDPECSPPG
jgi:hypothetical protein